MDKKEKTLKIIEILKSKYPDALCKLNYENPLELLIAARLSAQCTDKRVNAVTPILFSKYGTLEDFAEANPRDVAEIIRPCGFHNTKAEDIVNMSKMLRDDFGGKIPDNIEDLTKLPGVGRKIANLILGDVYNKPAVVCDTHVIRISNRLGLVNTRDPYKVEMELKELLPPSESSDFCHRMVLFGREVCKSRNPDCKNCDIKEFCQGNLTF